MKTLFDLRENQDNDIYEAIQKLFVEPLKIVNMQEQSISACIGCWNCWLKTPGRCVMKDEMSECYPDYVNSDTVILLMDTAQGFVNHRAKAFFDRTIPHYHPYIEMVGGECRHFARYEKYPDMVFHYETDGLTNQENQVIEDYLYRTAWHFQSKAFRIISEEGPKLIPLEKRRAKNKSIEFASAGPMGKLVIYNGSPRRTGSNSALILQHVAKTLDEKVEIRDLKKTVKWGEWVEAFKTEENVMLFMPLYVHAMPSHVMAFIEKLQASKGNISFFVQSGFPESAQSHYLEAYFELLSRRLGRTYLGTAIRGGVESMQIRPANAQEKMIEPMVKAIVNLVSDGKFNQGDINRLAKPVRLGKAVGFIYNLLSKIGLASNIFWDRQLKTNHAYEKSFDQPYLSNRT